MNVNGALDLNNRDFNVTADTINVGASISSGGGNVDLTATGDITLIEAVTTSGGGFSASADSDGDGTGTFTLADATMGAFEEQAILRASDAQTSDEFGFSVSVSGDTALIGAWQEDGGAGDLLEQSGAAYVFTRDVDGIWTQQAILRASDAQAFDGFGRSVAIDGNTAVVGAPFEDGTGGVTSSFGAAYVFTRDGGGIWTEQAILRASDAGVQDFFGSSVSISGDTALIGTADLVSTASPDGAAYVFTRDAGGIWTEQAILQASDAQADDNFGVSVSISGDTAVVGADEEDGGTGDPLSFSGAAYVFARDAGGNWTEQTILRASDAAAGDAFGRSVSISGDTVLVGASGGSAVSIGAAYVFTRDAGGNWTEHAILEASDSQPGDVFGFSVALSGDRAVVGAQGEDGGAGDPLSGSGAAYVFMRDSGGIWSEQTILRASDAQVDDVFGFPVSISNDTVLLGAFHEDGGVGDPVLLSGASYVFQQQPGPQGGSINAGSGNVSITAANVAFLGELSGTGSLTIEPSTVGSSIGIGGGTGDLNLDDA